MKDKVTLYIATHNTTGLKYFGKTVKYFTEEDLQRYYHGSGIYWNRHLKKHGDDVTMEIYGIYSLNENDEDYVKPIALQFSYDNNITEDYDNWANMEPETGFSGGPKTPETIEKMLKTRNTVGPDGLTSYEHSVIKLTKTVNDPQWKDTIGKQKIIDMKTTINDSEWKDTIGKEQVRKQLETKSSKEWKETIGKKAYLDMVETRMKNDSYTTGVIKRLETISNDDEISFEKISAKTANTRRERGDFEKLSKTLQGVGIAPIKVTCEFCGKESNSGNHKRWHGGNCKQNPNVTEEQLKKREPHNKGISKK